MDNNTLIGKRINLKQQNLKRVKILTMLFEDEITNLNEKKKLDYIINKAIESFYSSKEVKELLEL